MILLEDDLPAGLRGVVRLMVKVKTILVVISLPILPITFFGVVFFRYILEQDLFAYEEWLLPICFWIFFLSSAIGTYHGKQINADLLDTVTDNHKFMWLRKIGVTAIELVIHGYFHELYLILGIFIPLIVTNCSIIARAESFAAKHNVFKSFFDGLMMGLGFTLVLVTLGALREILGSGTLLSNAHLMFGEDSKWLTVTLIEDYKGFLLAILPPGAFMGLAVLLAVKNYIDKQQTEKKRQLKKQASLTNVVQP